MALSISQDYEYTGSDTWKWWVWLDGTDDELDAVHSVEYHLHPTFPNPVREVTRRDTRFRLDAVGWGVFQIKARVRQHDGSLLQLSHMLELDYPPGIEGDAPEKAPTRSGRPERRRSVFLSAGSADGALASELRESLTDKGVDVWSDDDLEAGMPWEVEIARALSRSDAVVAVSSDVPSTWLEREVGAATQQGTKVIPVVVGDNAIVPKSLESVQQIRIQGGDAVEEAAASIVRAIEA